MSPRLRTLSALLSPARPSASGDHACAAAAFSTTAAASYAAAQEPNYYEILNVPVTASAAEIKKQFYALSLTHHPDRNRSDPTATSRFASISSAYHVLSDSTKRARYDRDHGFHRVAAHSSASSSPGQHPMGSYSSYGANLHNKGSYVGSRPASGLSKRRGPFRGPPPSFYAHGGYGANAARNNNSAGMGGQTSSSSSASASTGGSGSKGSSSSPTHEDPTSFIDRNPVYHFNARSHFRTQAAEDARRQQRRSREMGIDLDDPNPARGGSMVLRFMVVCGILAGAGATAGLSGRRPTTSGSGGSSRSR